MSFPPEIKVASVVYIMEFSWKPDKCSEALVWGVGGLLCETEFLALKPHSYLWSELLMSTMAEDQQCHCPQPQVEGFVVNRKSLFPKEH